MKNRKSLYIVLALVIAIVGLGIGYAVSTIDLTVNGNATANQSNEFEVSYTGNTTGTSDAGATAAATEHATSATCDVSMTAVGESKQCVFEVKNYSPSTSGINATLTTANLNVYSDSTFETEWNNATNEWFNITVTPGWQGSSTVLAPQGTTSFTVTVSLKKANLSSDPVTQTFYVKSSGISASLS